MAGTKAKGGRKLRRTAVHAEMYKRQFNRTARNRRANLERHLAAHPWDDTARSALRS